MHRITIDIPALPPSVNHYYLRAGNRTYKSKQAKEFVELVQYIALSELNRLRISERPLIKSGRFFYMLIDFQFKTRVFCDPNNMLKLLIDSLEGIVYENDKWLLPVVISAKISGSNRTTVQFKEGEKWL